MPQDAKNGSPATPLKIKCTSIGVPSQDEAYWCIVSEDGREFYFDVSKMQAQLISAQAGAVARRAQAVSS